MGRGLDWSMLEPAQRPTVGELRILTALRSIGYGELKVIVQANRIAHVDMLHQARHAAGDAQQVLRRRNQGPALVYGHGCSQGCPGRRLKRNAACGTG